MHRQLIRLGSRLATMLILLLTYQYAFTQAVPHIYAITSQGGTLNGGTIINLAGDGYVVKTTSYFGTPLVRPRHRNVVGPDGYLYNFGYGGNQTGGLFRIRFDGSNYSQLLDFGNLENGFSEAPGLSNGSMVITQDGVIFGMTVSGGLYHSGLIYRINADGTRYKKLVEFQYPATTDTDFGTLLLGKDNFLYGTHQWGSTGNQGSIFKVSTDGSGLTEIFKFSSQNLANGRHLHWGTDGRLYGSAQISGSGLHVLFRINTDGSNYQVIHIFNESIESGVIEASDGMLYGTAGRGGDFDRGYAYRCAPDGSSFGIVHQFDSDTGAPSHGLLERPDGFMYGLTTAGLTFSNGIVYKMNPDGTAFEMVHQLPMSGAKSELSSLDGDLFLFTSRGGTDDNGTLYRIHDSEGTIVHHFIEDQSHAIYPFAGLAKADDGTMHFLAMRREVFYKASLLTFSSFTGALESTTEKFPGVNSSGISQMVNGNDGYWYWMNSFAGGSGSIVRGKLDSSPPERLYDFFQNTGNFPFYDIVVHKGYVYGSCMQGGATSRGVIYRLKTDGTGYQVLRVNQRTPLMPNLAIGPDDRIYAADDAIFSMKLDGSDYKALHPLAIGRTVSAPLTILGDKIFGVLSKTDLSSYSGGVFTIDISGSDYRDLHTFTHADGDSPFTSLLPYRGKLIGATYRGGQNDWGTLYAVDLTDGKLSTAKHLDHETGYGVALKLAGNCIFEPAPTLSMAGNTLTSGAVYGNQWYRDDEPIPGAVHQSLEVVESGRYQVMTWWADCPSELSQPITMTIDGVEEESGLALYPNPTSGKFVVATGTNEAQIVNIVVTDAIGIVAAAYEGPGGDVQLDLGGRAPGLYMVSIGTAGGVTQRKLVKL